LLRTGILVTVLGLSYQWTARAGVRRWSPMQQLGRTSLFIYWIHVEMVYGLISLPVHKSLTLPQAWGAYAAFCVFLLGCSVLKDRAAARLRRRRPTGNFPVFAR
jgi:fucose 4-O-acetylase-like acetyltransferase